MGVLLRGEHGDFALNNFSWATLLRLAWDQGWRPAGTRPPGAWEAMTRGDPTRQWNPADYVTCRGQRVRDDDAKSLGKALANVMDDLPNHDPLVDAPVVRCEAPGCLPRVVFGVDRQVHPFELLGGPNKEAFAAFVAYCQRGGFEIW